MSLISLIIVLIIIGVVLYLINTVIPMDAKIKTVINVLVILFVCIWLLQSLGAIGGVPLRL